MFQKTLLLLLALVVGVSAWASQDGNTVLQEQWGRQVIDVAADQEITFYDWKGTESIASSSLNNSRSLTVFKPAEGMSIQITFESIDVTNDGASWMGEVWVYSGDPDSEGSFEYNATLSSTSTLPEGTVLDKLDGKYSNKTYTSASADGMLSVGMLWRYAKACDGWVAKVKCVTLEDMTVTGAGSNYDGVGGSLTSRNNVALANAYVTATGVMNPDHVTTIGFTMMQNDNAFDPLALKLFKDGAQVSATVSADGENYAFALDEALSDGTTTFTIAGDFLATSAVGAKAQVDITKIASTGQADGIAPFTSATSVEVVNPAIVIMGSEAQTVTVGETSLAFFDEGGKRIGAIYRILSDLCGVVPQYIGLGDEVVLAVSVDDFFLHSDYKEYLNDNLVNKIIDKEYQRNLVLGCLLLEKFIHIVDSKLYPKVKCYERDYLIGHFVVENNNVLFNESSIFSVIDDLAPKDRVKFNSFMDLVKNLTKQPEKVPF